MKGLKEQVCKVSLKVITNLNKKNDRKKPQSTVH